MNLSDRSISPRSVLWDSALYGVSAALSRLGGLISLPLLTRSLTVEEYGQVELGVVLLGLLATLLRFGFPPSLARFWEKHRAAGSIPELLSSLLAWHLVSASLLGLSLFLAVLALPSGSLGDSPWRFLLGWIVLTALLQAATTLLTNVLRMRRWIWRFNAVNLLGVVTYLGWLLSRNDLAIRDVFAGLLLGATLPFLLALLLVRRDLRPVARWSLARQALSFGGPLLISRLFQRSFEPLSRLLVLSVVGLPGVAMVGVGVRIASLLALPESLFALAWQPHAMRLIETQPRSSVFSTIFRYYLAGLLSLALLVSSSARELLLLLAGPSYGEVWILVPGLLVGVASAGVVGFARLGMLASKKTLQLVWFQLAAVLLSLSLCWLFVPRVGVVGLSVAVPVSGIALVIGIWIRSERLSVIRLDWIAALQLSALAVLGFVASIVGHQADVAVGWRVGCALVVCSLLFVLAFRRARVVESGARGAPLRDP